MTGTEVMDIINLICEKAGLAVESAVELLPALAKYKVIDSAIGIAFCIVYILAVTAYAIFILSWSLKKPYDDRVVWDFVLGILIFIGVFVVMGLMGQISVMFAWIITPETAFIRWVLELLT